MGRAIDYCAVCGDRVPASDLEKGKAVEVAEKVYCGKCRAKAPAPVAAPSTGRKRTGATGQFQAIRPAGTGTGRIPNVGSGSQRLAQVGPGTQRLAHVVDDAPAEKSKAPFIAGGVAAVVLLGAVILFVVQNSQENAAKELERNRIEAAKVAFAQVVTFRHDHPDDADGLLQLIDLSIPKCRNSDWSGKLAAEREDAVLLKKQLDIKKERTGRLEALRLQVATAKDLTPLIEQIEKFQKEMEATGGDPELAKSAAALAKFAKEKQLQGAIDEAKNFEVQNPEKFSEAIEKWAAVKMMCDGYESFRKQAEERLTAVKTKREEMARIDWDKEKTKIEGLRKQKKWEECQTAIRAFRDKWKDAAVVEDATKLAWDIDKEAKAATEKPPVKPDPSKVPPKDWVTLFDEKTPGTWQQGGANVKWELQGGVMVGTNAVSEEDAKKDTNRGIGFWFSGQGYAGYELQVEFTLVKGEGMIVVGINGIDENPPAIPIHTKTSGAGAEVVLAADKPFTMTVQVRGDSIAINGAGISGGNWKFQGAGDGKDHGAGSFGLALGPQGEVRIRAIKIRAIP